VGDGVADQLDQRRLHRGEHLGVEPDFAPLRLEGRLETERLRDVAHRARQRHEEGLGRGQAQLLGGVSDFANLTFGLIDRTGELAIEGRQRAAQVVGERAQPERRRAVARRELIRQEAGQVAGACDPAERAAHGSHLQSRLRHRVDQRVDLGHLATRHARDLFGGRAPARFPRRWHHRGLRRCRGRGVERRHRRRHGVEVGEQLIGALSRVRRDGLAQVGEQSFDGVGVLGDGRV